MVALILRQAFFPEVGPMAACRHPRRLSLGVIGGVAPDEVVPRSVPPNKRRETPKRVGNAGLLKSTSEARNLYNFDREY
jgi:uncharacterized NAD-dependent epimerase/dehydratase family protein